jgi:type 1 fimbria pilin
MARPASITLTPIVEENTWDGLTVSWTSDGTAFADPLASVIMEFKDAQDVAAQTLDSADGGIVIDDANAWEITIPATILTLSAGVWKWSITTTDTEGVVKTRIAGELTILDK